MSIALGDPLPAFDAILDGGRTVRSSDFQGQFLVLYFYPKDHTPGCTQESQEFRDHANEINELGAVILGISRDSASSHEKFKAKHELPFDLISDSDETICTLFDVIKMKNMYGKQVRGIQRSTFLFDRNGLLAHAWRKVTVKGHVEQVVATLRSLSA